jgi:hypothetical protein
LDRKNIESALVSNLNEIEKKIKDIQASIYIECSDEEQQIYEKRIAEVLECITDTRTFVLGQS